MKKLWKQISFNNHHTALLNPLIRQVEFLMIIVKILKQNITKIAQTATYKSYSYKATFQPITHVWVTIVGTTTIETKQKKLRRKDSDRWEYKESNLE